MPAQISSIASSRLRSMPNRRATPAASGETRPKASSGRGSEQPGLRGGQAIVATNRVQQRRRAGKDHAQGGGDGRIPAISSAGRRPVEEITEDISFSR